MDLYCRVTTSAVRKGITATHPIRTDYVFISSPQGTLGIVVHGEGWGGNFVLTQKFFALSAKLQAPGFFGESHDS